MRREHIRSGASAQTWYDHALTMLRPGVEAVLLASVALGCVEIGWKAVAPEAADAVANPASSSVRGAAGSSSPKVSPFAPFAAVAGATPTSGLAANLRLVGVRMALDPALSGAVVTVNGEDQRSYLVGQEIVSGLRLKEVYRDHIVVTTTLGEEPVRLQERPASNGSTALALMGRTANQLPALTVETVVGGASKQQRAVGADFQVDHGWLIATMSQVESRGGAPYAWRVAEPTPAAMQDAGLQPGDLVLSINGTHPSNAAALAETMGQGSIELIVERRTGERITIALPANGSPS
ncbi:hypothetical protein GC169_00450 [bacterium]|nr:hypothetical protein [bacterium]